MDQVATINGKIETIDGYQVHIYETEAGGLHSFRAYMKGNAAIQAWGHTSDAAYDNLIEVMENKGII